MLLAIDVGNSSVALGLADGDEWVSHWRIETDPLRTADEYGILVAELFELDGRPQESVTAVVATCVVPGLRPVFSRMCRRRFGFGPLFVAPGLKTGMNVKYDPPRIV